MCINIKILLPYYKVSIYVNKSKEFLKCSAAIVLEKGKGYVISWVKLLVF